MVEKAAVLVEVEHKDHAVPLRTVLQRVVDLREETFRHLHIPAMMIVVGRSRILRVVRIIRVHEHHVCEIATARILPKAIDRK